jgi:hypothetical protein
MLAKISDYFSMCIKNLPTNYGVILKILKKIQIFLNLLFLQQAQTLAILEIQSGKFFGSFFAILGAFLVKIKILKRVLSFFFK